MTYSIIAQCPETGAFGGAIGTSSLAVGNRCLHLRHGYGAFLSQHRTDPRLGVQGADLLAAGRSAADAMADVVKAPDIGWRQLAALDARGGTAWHHGDMIYSITTHALGDHCIAVGNILDNDQVTAAMVAAYEAARGQRLEERLVTALEAGRDAGGEALEPLHSAAVRVSGEDGMDRIDLRIDRADEAAGALRELLTALGDQADTLRRLAFAPGEVPISRALFDASMRRIRELGLKERFPSESQAHRWNVSG
jgi:uncharacterized Ntn-hydrolase superfamily protein